MATAVNVPGVGPVQRRWIFVGAAAVAVIVGAAYWMRARSGQGGVAYDPATGSVGDGPYVNPAPNGPDSGGVVNPEIIDTNAEWGQAAVQRLMDIGYEPQFAAEAIGKYLAEIPLTTAEANAVRAAWGMLGKPPVNPPPIILIQTGPAPGTGNPNPPPPPVKTTPPPAKPKPPRRYVTVQRYTTANPPWQSTLSGIAGRTGRSVAQLASWNGISNPNLIHPGQTIWIDPPPASNYLGSKKFG